LGRYGPEMGTDQFGAQIMISGQQRQAGQPESVIADMPSSYVSECAIHESFMRATNMHASNYILIERNVIYNIMGGAYFLEDGVEIGNIYQYNLAVLVKPSSSSIAEDVTPG